VSCDHPLVIDLSDRIAVAVDAVRAACEVCLAAARPSVMHKDGAEPVTVADFASQAVLLRRITDTFPEDRVLAEESAAHLGELGGVEALATAAVLAKAPDAMALLDWVDRRGGTGEVVWAIDPIDGTKGYLRGDQFAVAVGIIHQGTAVAGVLGLPRYARGESAGVVLWGGIGIGAFVHPLAGGTPSPVTVTDTNDPGALRVLGSVEPAHGDPVAVADLIDRLGIEGGWLRMDSQAKYGAVAMGDADVYVRPRNRPDYRERVWDHAAGAAIVTAAGGRVTDLDGADLDFSHGARLDANRGVVATNGPLHDRIVAGLNP
jgi:HAL2 family 3'(2'),5'-bisphosphate nucleotidase